MMQVYALSENTACSSEFGCEHGLSLLFQANDGHQSTAILFDTGASDLFIRNAQAMNVDLETVEAAVISHGHYDHGGGLPAFIEKNRHAKIYIQEAGFGGYYAAGETTNAAPAYIGIDASLKDHSRVTLCGNHKVIRDDLPMRVEVFSGVSGHEMMPLGNSALLERKGEAYVPDGFHHEQNMILETQGRLYLIAGCAHSGILNILNEFEKIKGCQPDVVIGGLHLYSRAGHSGESRERIDMLGAQLLQTKAQFYTCHCTGIEAYDRLKAVMGEKISYLSAGMVLNF